MLRRVFTVAEQAVIDVPAQELMSGGVVDLYPEVAGKGYVKAGLVGSAIRFQAGGYIGLIPLNDRVALEVVPKVPADRITRMLDFAGDSPVTVERLPREYLAEAGTELVVRSILATELVAAVEEVVKAGLRRGYVSRTQETSFPRGRLLVGRTVQLWGKGSRVAVATRWYEPTQDSAENRWLLAALELVARQFDQKQRRKGELRLLDRVYRLIRVFRSELVSPVAAGDERLVQAAVRVERLSGGYLRAVSVASLLLGKKGVKLPSESGNVRLPSMLVDLETAFEGYVRGVLQRGLPKDRLRVLNGNWAPPAGGRRAVFDDRTLPDANPDVVVHDRDGGCRAIVEVKYKRLEGSPGRDDLNQAIAYGVSYRSPIVLLAYPATSPSDTECTRIGVVNGIRVELVRMPLTGDTVAAEAGFIAAVLRCVNGSGDADASN